MPKQKINVVTHGMSGKVDLLVFRQRYGRTVISKAPVYSGLVSAAQEQVRSTFKQAVMYAKAALTDLAIKAAYKAKAKLGQTPYNVALADFFKPPVIEEIDSSHYNGQSGSIIKVLAYDDFMVKDVQVRIEKANGTLIEEGSAILSGDGLHWDYTATASNATTANCKLIITATDQPGHSIVKQKTI